MQKILLFVGATLLSCSAYAADLGNGKMQEVYDSPASNGGWSGVYFGGHVGYGWNKHDIKETSTDTIPGTDAYCKEGTPTADGKSCEVITKQASCTSLDTNKSYQAGEDGKCYEITSPEHCGYGEVNINHQCYSILDASYDAPRNIWVANNDAKPEHPAFAPVVAKEPTTTGVTYNKQEVKEAPEGSYVPAVDAQTIITNTLTSLDPDGIFGGVRIGADYQPRNSRVVFGVFGDFNFADNDVTTSGGHKLADENSYMIAGRVGALMNDKTLIYALAGYGWQDVTYNHDLDKTFNHIVAGAGFEYKLTENLTFGLEAQHWFAEKKTIEEEVGFKATDERSDTRVLARVNYRIGM